MNQMENNELSEYVYLNEICKHFNCNFPEVISICMMEGRLVSLNQKFYLTDDEDLKLLNIIEKKLNEKV